MRVARDLEATRGDPGLTLEKLQRPFHAHAGVVDETLANAIRKSTAQIDKASAKELKEGLEEAGAGLAGTGQSAKGET